MDAVLLDAPCTGLGVLTEKPDLKYRLKETDIQPIVETPEKASGYPERLCTAGRHAGLPAPAPSCQRRMRSRWRRFSRPHPDYSLAPLPASYPEAIRAQYGENGLQLFAHRDSVEGFFIARLRRARA